MRIGIISGEYPPMQGGVGDYSREFGRALVALGHEVFVLTSSQAHPLTEDTGIKVQATVNQWGRWGNQGKSPRGERQAIEWAQQNRLDIVNMQYQAAAYNMHAAANYLPRTLSTTVPIITTFHDLLVPYLFPKAGPLRKRLIYQMARQSSGVIVTNIADEWELREAGDMPPIARIPIGSNIAVQPPAGYDPVSWRVNNLRIPSETFLVGYFGFINATKGVDTLAHAVRLLIDRHVNVELLIIGGQTGASDKTNLEQADEAERLIGGLGINRRVHWTGFVEAETVSAHLMACDIIALPFKDGVSLRRGTLMAALAHGCPIISTQPQVKIPELEDKAALQLVPPDNPHQLAEALLDMHKNEGVRLRLGQSAAELSRQFQWDSIATAALDFIEQIIV